MTKLSVILPVYNAEHYLRDAVESLLTQTFPDFVVIAVDDGSSDKSLSVLRSISDSRLTILANERNRGLVATLNLAATMVKTPFVARMDADDISLPDRFQKQIEFLERHTSVGVLGSWAEDMVSGVPFPTPVGNHAIKTALLANSAFIHPSVMIRTELLKVTPYSSSFPHAEDYKLWIDLASVTEFQNLPEPLLRYRSHPAQVSSRFGKVQRDSRIGIIREYLRQWFGQEVSEETLQAHLQLVGVTPLKDIRSVERLAHELRSPLSLRGFEARFELEAFLALQFQALLQRNLKVGVLDRVRRKLGLGTAS